MMIALHKNARTTLPCAPRSLPADKPLGILARR